MPLAAGPSSMYFKESELHAFEEGNVPRAMGSDINGC